MTDEIFIEICNKAISMAEAAKKVELSFSTFKRKAVKLNCYNTKQNWRKGKTSFSDERIKSKYSETLFCVNSTARRDYIKSLIIKNNLLEYKCLECDLEGMWNNKKLNLHLDHINGFNKDNRLENLRFLCPNCHTQTETYCNKNNGK